LSGREAARRLEVSGPNELVRRGGRRWPAELARQFTHPLALLLAAAAVLAWASGTPRLAVAIIAVILLNASFSFMQELQAERAVEALAAFLPERAQVLRDGSRQEIEARLLVPGDVLLIEEGERICADARLMTGTLEVDMSTLTGESVPVIRSAETLDGRVPLLQARDLVFSGSECTGGEAQAVVTATGMGTELGRIAALSQRVGREESPLEHQVKRVARLIAFVAIGAGLAFLPIGLAERRDAMRRRLFRFDPRIKLMTTVDEQDGGLIVHTKGAPEEVLARAARIRRGPDEPPITAADRAAAARVMDDYARQGLRVLAFGRQTLLPGAAVPGQREEAERDLCLIGLVAMLDPPRSEVPAAIRRCTMRASASTWSPGTTG